MRAHVRDLLRAQGDHAPDAPFVRWRRLAGFILVAGFLYGAVMGSWSGRATQALVSGVKTPMLLVVTTALVLPFFFVVNTILGLRDDFGAACRGVLAAQATAATTLAALSPLTLVAYASVGDYGFATVWNGIMFFTATLAAQRTLARHYDPLIARRPPHRVARNAWILLYVFTAIQMAWVLRPFIGDPSQRVRFLRTEAWGNAYVDGVNAFASHLRAK